MFSRTVQVTAADENSDIFFMIFSPVCICDEVEDKNNFTFLPSNKTLLVFVFYLLVVLAIDGFGA